MRWYKISGPDSAGLQVWVSEREVNQEQSRIRGIDDKFYAIGQNYGTYAQKTFDSLKEAKKWVRDCTGWGPNP